jgi:hypothetical protein
MPLFLLLLGVLTTVAGLVLVGSGVAIRDGTFETEVLTPGTIAAVGGLLLIGLGLAVRELRRIERALAVRPMPRLARTGEAAATAAVDASDVAVSIPFPPRPKSNPQPASADAAAAPAPAATEDVAFERLRAKFPTLARVENGPIVEGGGVAVTPRPPLGVEENVADLRSTAAAGRATNGAAGPAQLVPRLDVKPSAPASPGKAKVSVFNAFWPAAPRRDGQAAPSRVAAPVPPPVSEPEAPASVSAAGEAPVSVLKSGVVEGMAYTLYSDGSIEAQLPQGTLRFGSITALRNHIESTA